jgi:recombination protein RecA
VVTKVKENEGKEKALVAALGDLRKRFGEGSIMRLGERNELQIETIPTGCLSLDIALGVGGVPKGRVIEIYGPESSGKTTLCQHIIAESQKQGGVCAFVDVEHALDPTYAEKCGEDDGGAFSLTPVSKLWKLPRRWCALERLMWWWLTA